ncbi:uncharacterized protein BT62DRAFT_135516 [Guyanagaster necrorhizus]|uniref:Uncharacterized protein n=1 Tax=Guyanagaster necrorhizus TaxID=856835 RepID=A0A9P7VFK3_9AGAR|nr:uncharacterized protein BT62DRAFT_135516 [Guyanagaster necrorhizus MCA 3950]KAG7439079.1 hypothetical protein BT62DRAFT_135516 [Guyanagaster necrorhizus MCA 3950]
MKMDLSSSALFHYIAVHLVSSLSISVRFSLVQEDRVKTEYKTCTSREVHSWAPDMKQQNNYHQGSFPGTTRVHQPMNRAAIMR